MEAVVEVTAVVEAPEVHFNREKYTDQLLTNRKEADVVPAEVVSVIVEEEVEPEEVVAVLVTAVVEEEEVLHEVAEELQEEVVNQE